jgi:hypothetical protein
VAGIVYYVSGHGYGHAVRSALVISAIRRLNPEIPLWVRTSAPPWLFPSDVAVEPSELDLGVLQRGSLHVRPRDTLEEYARLIRSEELRIENEIGLARTRPITCVVADIPSAAFEVASKLDVPSIGVANFCWHWVYQPYARRFPELAHVVRHIERQEGLATVLLRLPFAWDFNCFQRIRDVPLIGRSAEHSRSETRMRLGIEAERRVALLSFGGYGFDGLGQEQLNRLKDWLFLTTESTNPPGRRKNIQNVVQPNLSYVDILAASDVVVTKPGFGIVSDALVNRISVLYSDRGEFREYGVLARGLRSLGRAKYIPRPDLERGRLGPYLEALMDNDRPWTPLDWSGADVIARQVLESAR